MRKWYGSQCIKMLVVANNVFCICNDGAVHKLVVIRICCDKVKSVLSIHTQNICCS